MNTSDSKDDVELNLLWLVWANTWAVGDFSGRKLRGNCRLVVDDDLGRVGGGILRMTLSTAGFGPLSGKSEGCVLAIDTVGVLVTPERFSVEDSSVTVTVASGFDFPL